MDVNNFEGLKISIASPEKFVHGLMVKLKKLKLLIIVH